MHARKHNRWRSLLFFLLVLSGWLCPGGLCAREEGPDTPAAAAAETPPPLTLADVINLALRDNRTLLSSSYGVESRQLSVDVAESEFEWKLFPQATATASDETRSLGGGVTVEKKFAPGPIASVSPEIVRNYDGDSDGNYGSVLGLSLTMPLLRGFGTEINLDGVRTAEYSLRSARRSHYLVKVNTVLEAVAAVYNIVQQRELVHMYADQAQRFFGHVVMAQAREKIGLATPIDVYRAQIRLKDVQDSLNRSQEALRNAGDRLKIVLATPLEQAVNVVAPLEWQPVDISIGRAVETAMQYRVELQQSDDDLREARRGSRISRNGLLPQLDLVANYTRLGNDDAFAGSTSLDEEFWSVNLVSTTDWSRTAEKASYRQSLLAIKQVQLSRASRVDGIKREVRQVYDALQKARERMQIRKDQIDQAAGKLALAKIKFSHGMADNFDLIEAETELQQARSDLLAARVEYIVGIYRLRAAIGTLIES
jgi:outer membrane protein